MSTELAIRPDQTFFDEKQMAALHSLGVQNASNADVALFFHQAARTGLDPFARQIYLINRGGKQTIQVGIDGFRLIRDRRGTYQGHTEEWCGPDGQWRDVWLEATPPAAARVSVYVKGYVHPVVGIALWSEYAQVGRDGRPQALWGSKPALMLAKCAEALALRKAYPQDLSGLYTTDELPEAEETGGVPSVTRVQPPRAARAPHEGGADVTDREAAEQWIARITEAHSIETLDRLYADAKNTKVLQLRDGENHTVQQWFNRRHTELEQDAASEPEAPVEAEPVLTPDYEDEVPF